MILYIHILLQEKKGMIKKQRMLKNAKPSWMTENSGSIGGRWK